MKQYSKAEVAFEHPAKGGNHCSMCRHFESPDSCEIVDGRIMPQDWCKKFSKEHAFRKVVGR